MWLYSICPESYQNNFFLPHLWLVTVLNRRSKINHFCLKLLHTENEQWFGNFRDKLYSIASVTISIVVILLHHYNPLNSTIKPGTGTACLLDVNQNKRVSQRDRNKFGYSLHSISFMGVSYFFSANSKHFFEKDIRIKIENQKILILMSKLSLKLDEVNVIYLNYPCKYIIQSCETFMYFIVFHQFAT